MGKGYTRCIVCDVRSDRTENSFFRVPLKENVREDWIKNLAITRKIAAMSFVCEEHFDSDDVLSKTKETKGKNGEILIASIPYKIKRLRKGAKPHLAVQFCSTSVSDDIPSIPNYGPNSDNLSSLESSDILSTTGILLEDIAISSPNSDPSSDLIDLMEIPEQSEFQFVNILAIKDEIPDWTSHHDAGVLNFTLYKNQVSREVIINSEANIEAKVFEKEIPIAPTPASVADFKTLLTELNQSSTCSGYPFYDMFRNVDFRSAYKDKNVMRHKNCPIIIPRGTICLKCHSLEKTLFAAVDNSKKKKQRMRSAHAAITDLQFYRKKQKIKTQRLTRKDNKLKMLQDKIREHRLEIAKITESFDDKISNLKLPPEQENSTI